MKKHRLVVQQTGDIRSWDDKNENQLMSSMSSGNVSDRSRSSSYFDPPLLLNIGSNSPSITSGSKKGELDDNRESVVKTKERKANKTLHMINKNEIAHEILDTKSSGTRRQEILMKHQMLQEANKRMTNCGFTLGGEARLSSRHRSNSKINGSSIGHSATNSLRGGSILE